MAGRVDEERSSRVAQSSRIDERVDELTQEHEEHEEEHQEHKNTHDTRTVSLTGRSNRPNRIHTKVGDRQVDTRRDLRWLFFQRSTEPLQ